MYLLSAVFIVRVPASGAAVRSPGGLCCALRLNCTVVGLSSKLSFLLSPLPASMGKETTAADCVESKSGTRAFRMSRTWIIFGVALLFAVVSVTFYFCLNNKTHLTNEMSLFSYSELIWSSGVAILKNETEGDVRARKLRISKRRKQRAAKLRREKERRKKDATSVLMDRDGVKPFKHLDGMKHIPDDALVKKDLLSDSFLLRGENVLYRSPAATKYAEERKAAKDKNLYMPSGVVWGVVGSSAVGKQNKDLKTGLEVFQRYMHDITCSAQSTRMFLEKNDQHPVGLAVVIDFALEDMLPEQIEMFDYIIYNRIPAEAAEYFPHGIGWCGKVSIMLFTPFEQTLYVDADTRFCADVRPEFESLSSASIALAHEARASLAQHGSVRLNFNAGVIVYRKSAVVATLMHDVIQSIMLNQRGDQVEWANRLMEFRRFGNVRVNILSSRFHMQPCRYEAKERCVVSGDVILLHGRCWFWSIKTLEEDKNAIKKFCGHLNSYKGSRLVTTMCKPNGKNLGIHRLALERFSATLTELKGPVEEPT